MAYCTIDNIIPGCISETEAIQLTSDDNTEDATVNADIITQAINDSTGEINSYLGKAYSLPLPTAILEDPAAVARLREVNEDMAVYRLFKKRAAKLGMPEAIRAAYDDAVSWLNKIARRDISIGVTPAPEQSPSEGAQFNADPRVFTNKSMRGY